MQNRFLKLAFFFLNDWNMITEPKDRKYSVIWCSWAAVSRPDDPIIVIHSQHCVSGVLGKNGHKICTSTSYTSLNASTSKMPQI